MHHTPSMTNPPARERMLRAMLWMLVLLGSALVVSRGVWRGTLPEGNRDFRLLYSCAKAWIAGVNPYDDAQVRAEFDRKAGAPGVDAIGAERTSHQLVYPPATFPVIAPLAALPWRVASPIWIAVNVALYPACIAMLACALRLRGTSLLAMWAGGLMLGPAQIALTYGQPSIVALALIVGAWLVRARESERIDTGRQVRVESWRTGVIAGGLLGVAIALKPSMGLLFLVYEIGRLRWRVAIGGAVSLGVAWALGAGRLALDGIPWRAAWQRNVANFTTISDGAPLASNDSRHHMLNLHYPLGTLISNMGIVKPLVIVVFAIISLAYLFADMRGGGARNERRLWRGEILSLSMTSAITLSIVYHRFYDAVLMLFPLALIVLWWSRPLAPRARLVATLIVIGFITQWSIVLAAIESKGVLSHSFTQGPIWIGIIMPAQAWLLPVLAVTLVVARWKSGPDVLIAASAGEARSAS